jgi:NodT family efflux transporter outer membrane factor (OMF) lipoprotein
MKSPILFAIGCSLALSSCHLYSNYERGENVVSDSLFRDTTSTYAILVGDTASFGDTPWREVFTDPQLQTLIEKALANNASLRTADITIQQAQTGLKISRLAYLPSLAFSPTGTLSSYDGGKATKTYTLPVQASWQLDFFGTLRNAKQQAAVQLEQSKAGYAATRTAIIAAVANLYYTLQMLDEQLSITRDTYELWGKNVDAMETMFQVGGLTNSAAVAQAKANRYQIESTIPTLEQSITSAENALCVLLHETPHPITRGRFNADAFPTTFATGVPLRLLDNRPDVRAAEMNLAYAFYGTNAARGAFYPQITLSGSAGWTNSAGSAIINPAKFIASAVGSLVQPLFARGTLMGQLKISKLQQEAAQINFESTLLQAGQEVSDALMSYHSAEQREGIQTQQVAELEHAVESTNFLFTHGNTTSYLETLTAQQSLLQAQLSLISDKFDKVQSAISLYQALGGGRD